MCADLQRLFTSDVLSVASRTKLEGWMQQGQTGLKMIRAGIAADWKVGDKTGRSGDGATNDIAVLRPPGGGPIFLAIYTVDPAEPQDARDQFVAEVAKTAIEALKTGAGTLKGPIPQQTRGRIDAGGGDVAKVLQTARSFFCRRKESDSRKPFSSASRFFSQSRLALTRRDPIFVRFESILGTLLV